MHMRTLSHFNFLRAHLAHDLDVRGRLDLSTTLDILGPFEVNIGRWSLR
jgi:hypothetical protein